jgi:hypothetical protein
VLLGGHGVPKDGRKLLRRERREAHVRDIQLITEGHGRQEAVLHLVAVIAKSPQVLANGVTGSPSQRHHGLIAARPEPGRVRGGYPNLPASYLTSVVLR